jgi:hypothetical protein
VWKHEKSYLTDGNIICREIAVFETEIVLELLGLWTSKQLWVRLTQQFFFSSSDVSATTCFDHFDRHQAADSGVLSQAVCLTGIAVSCISSHELWLPW